MQLGDSSEAKMAEELQKKQLDTKYGLVLLGNWCIFKIVL